MQIWQPKGFSLLWTVRMCLSRSPFVVDRYWHWSHRCGLSYRKNWKQSFYRKLSEVMSRHCCLFETQQWWHCSLKQRNSLTSSCHSWKINLCHFFSLLCPVFTNISSLGYYEYILLRKRFFPQKNHLPSWKLSTLKFTEKNYRRISKIWIELRKMKSN